MVTMEVGRVRGAWDWGRVRGEGRVWRWGKGNARDADWTLVCTAS